MSEGQLARSKSVSAEIGCLSQSNSCGDYENGCPPLHVVWWLRLPGALRRRDGPNEQWQLAPTRSDSA